MKNEISCQDVLNLLKSDYLDNELDPAVKTRVDRHLDGCASCRSVKENLLAIATPLRTAARETPPPALWLRIQAELNPQQLRIIRPKAVFQARVLELVAMRPSIAAAAAAVVLVLVSAAFYMQTRHPADTAPAAAAVTPDLGALTGNLEIQAPIAGFGSNIEQLFL